jgi:glycosyltransferase involved in cell wall biosynthesis
VLCAFNGEKYIREQVESILRQDPEAGPAGRSTTTVSTDRTRDILEQIARPQRQRRRDRPALQCPQLSAT